MHSVLGYHIIWEALEKMNQFLVFRSLPSIFVVTAAVVVVFLLLFLLLLLLFLGCFFVVFVVVFVVAIVVVSVVVVVIAVCPLRALKCFEFNKYR